MARLKVTVHGCGYVGLTAALCLARAGHEVLAVEIDPARLALLQRGKLPFWEPGLQELLEAGLASGRLVLAGQGRAPAEGELALVAVPTPGPAFRQVIEALLPGRGLVVVKSTLPLQDLQWAWHGLGERLVINPEFLREGHAVEDFCRPSRVVLGGSPAATARVAELYAALHGPDVPIVRTDARTAAVSKLAANAMLAVRVAFGNELARLAASYGAQPQGVLEVLSLDPRIGPSHLSPSVGYGGVCLPKDVALLDEVATALDTPLRVVRAAAEANREQQRWVVSEALNLLGALPDQSGTGRVAVWGVAFKPGTGDLRESVAWAATRALRQRGATVIVHDPLARLPEDEGLTQVEDPLAVVEGADLLLVGTPWPCYREIDPTSLQPRRKIALDPAWSLDRERWRAAGFQVQPHAG